MFGKSVQIYTPKKIQSRSMCLAWSKLLHLICLDPEKSSFVFNESLIVVECTTVIIFHFQQFKYGIYTFNDFTAYKAELRDEN